MATTRPMSASGCFLRYFARASSLIGADCGLASGAFCRVQPSNKTIPSKHSPTVRNHLMSAPGVILEIGGDRRRHSTPRGGCLVHRYLDKARNSMGFAYFVG